MITLPDVAQSPIWKDVRCLACKLYTNSHRFRYRLRLIHMGSAAQIRFSIDYHALTVIETDSTLTESYEVEGVTLNVAQRYSVLVTTNQDAESAGNYWMRAELISATTVSAGIKLLLKSLMRDRSSTTDVRSPQYSFTASMRDSFSLFTM